MTNAEVTALERWMDKVVSVHPELKDEFEKIERRFPQKQGCVVCGFMTRNQIVLKEEVAPLCGDCYAKGEASPTTIKTIAQAIEVLRA